MLDSRLFARHEHHEMPDGQLVTGDPIDGILWAHIIIMGLAFGVIFPIGMVAGLARHRLHVPVQIFGGVLALVGFFLGHAHKGRQFAPGNIHSVFSFWVMLILACQVGMGVILKLHIEKGFLGRVRRVIVKIHLVVAILMPIVSWVQMGFGAITIPAFCYADHLGQCLAHGIMGSSFILYGFILAMMLFVGEKFLTKVNKSQEFFDSTVIMLWGIVNTFTEHRWGQPWSHGDYQHTSMGIIWWCAGMLGVYLSWDRQNNRPQRNHIPALVMLYTGYAMSQHAQHLEVSTQVHFMFGVFLMAAGVCRIIEVSFVLRDAAHNGAIRSFQHLPPFLLVNSGMMFMAANEEQMQLLNDVGIMHSSYILVITSIAFIIYLLFVFLLNLYLTLSHRTGQGKSVAEGSQAFQPVGGIEMQPFLTPEEEVGLHEIVSDDDDDEQTTLNGSGSSH
jgi:hypothetical protein